MDLELSSNGSPSDIQADVLQRELHERATYDAIGVRGRSAHDDAELVIPEATVARYRRFSEGTSRPNLPLEQMIAWSAPLGGKRILEICGHTGEYGAILAKLGATVDSVDIAEPLVETAIRRAKVNGIESRLRPAVMSVHHTDFPDNTFDIVFGKSALHHLDLTAARDEILRVLKPGGVGIFSEPIVFSTLLRIVRPLIPISLNKESPEERQLTPQDLADFSRPFASSCYAYSLLFSRLGRLLPRCVLPLAKFDAAILRFAPWMKRYSGCCAFALTKNV